MNFQQRQSYKAFETQGNDECSNEWPSPIDILVISSLLHCHSLPRHFSPEIFKQ